MLKEVFIIGCSIESFKQLSMLSELVQILSENGKDFIISSHTQVPDFVTSKSRGFVYAPSNPKYNPLDLKGFPKSIYDIGGGFRVISPYILKGSIEYFNAGTFRLISLGLNLAKSLNYDVVHWIDYDALPNIEETNNNTRLLETNPMVFYGNSTHFSFLLDSVKEDIFNISDSQILDLLKRNDYNLSVSILNEFVYGRVYTKDEMYVCKFMGRYDQVSEKRKIDWSLFKRAHPGDLCLFMANQTDQSLDVKIECDGRQETIGLPGFNWLWRPISDANAERFKINLPNGIEIKLDLKDPQIYSKYIESVEVNL